MLALPYLATTPRHPVRRAEPRTCEQVSINGSPPAQSKLGGSGKEAQIKLRRTPNSMFSVYLLCKRIAECERECQWTLKRWMSARGSHGNDDAVVVDMFQIRDMRSHGAACLPRYSPILMQRNTTRLQRPGIVVFKHLQQRHVLTASAHNSQPMESDGNKPKENNCIAAAGQQCQPIYS